jgi:hypothetical protein
VLINILDPGTKGTVVGRHKPTSALPSGPLGIYFRQMSLARFLGKQTLGLSTVILVGCSALATAAVGQTTATAHPADCSAYESVPLPAEADKVSVPKTFPACASYRSYRGIGRPVNYAEARSCAWKERAAQGASLGQNQKEPTAWIVGGSLILADTYFNGAGVKRDVPLAMRFACETDEDMAKFALKDLSKPTDSRRRHGPVELCDYAMSTITMNFCSDYTSEVADDRRSRYYDSLKSSMTADQRAAFEKLLAAQSAYIEAHASEVYQGGTIRGIRTIGSQTILKNLFRMELVHFERKEWPGLSATQLTSADALLDREFKAKILELGKQTKEAIGEGAVTASDLSKVEEAWNAYSKAWVEFARLRYPSAVTQIRAEITLDRYRLVKTIV